MNGPEHYGMADRILRDSRRIDIGEEDGLPVAAYDDANRKDLLGALVHAVLALTAATAEPYGERHRPYVSSGERDDEADLIRLIQQAGEALAALRSERIGQ